MKKGNFATQYIFDVIPKPISLENEIQSWHIVKKAIKDVFNSFETSYDEDLSLLEDDSLTFNEKNCVKIRLRDKEILQANYDLAHKIATLGDLDKEEATQVISER